LRGRRGGKEAQKRQAVLLGESSLLRYFEAPKARFPVTGNSRSGEKESPARGGAVQFRRELGTADEADPVLSVTGRAHPASGVAGP
jgi:hypothetical protein